MAPKFPKALGQFKGSYEEMVRRMAREIDLGEELATLCSIHEDELREASADILRVLVDKTEAEANDKIKMTLQGEGIREYGVMPRWFTDVPGKGLCRSRQGG
jgi:hypothetical protein